jgi:putative DNA methylase
VFSKYAAVRQPDDTDMSVGRAIALINQVREEVAHADSGDLDAETRFALVWFESYGWGEKEAGQAILVGQSYNLTERELRDAGVLVTERGQARLRRRSEMPVDWRPLTDQTLTTWELGQAMNRALNDGGGVGAAAELLAEARGLGASAHWLAGRLFTLSENRRMTDEARGWGRLSEAWDAIEAAANAAPAPREAQPDLI